MLFILYFGVVNKQALVKYFNTIIINFDVNKCYVVTYFPVAEVPPSTQEQLMMKYPIRDQVGYQCCNH